MTTEHAPTPLERAQRVIEDYAQRPDLALVWLVESAIKQAVAAERERCAKVAEGMRHAFGSPLDCAYNRGAHDASAAIAAAIRSGEK